MKQKTKIYFTKLYDSFSYPDQSVNGFSRLPDKVACNPDGTYNIGKTCV